MKDTKNTSSGGLGLGSVLTIVFVVLKLVGVIDWSWVWVLSPLWISAILTVLVIVGVVLYCVYEDKKWDKEYGTTSRKQRQDKWKF